MQVFQNFMVGQMIFFQMSINFQQLLNGFMAQLTGIPMKIVLERNLKKIFTLGIRYEDYLSIHYLNMNCGF